MERIFKIQACGLEGIWSVAAFAAKSIQILLSYIPFVRNMEPG